MKGKNVDRHDFALQAVASGASILVIEHEVGDIPINVNIIKVENTRETMASIANRYYGEPSKHINLIGMLREMLDGGVTDVAMEVTSAALVNHRVDQCDFNIGVFTNLTQDHLDEHGTMENYKNAKLKLFNMCRYGVINADDPIYPDIKRTASCDMLLTYGINNDADIKAENIQYMMNGVKFTLNFNDVRKNVQIRIPGKFSVYNALAAIGACHFSGLTLEQIAKGIEMIEGVKGRFESIPNTKGCLVIVDYAHTPDGLENILSSVTSSPQ